MIKKLYKIITKLATILDKSYLKQLESITDVTIIKNKVMHLKVVDAISF